MTRSFIILHSSFCFGFARFSQSILQKAFTSGLCPSDQIHHHLEEHAW